MDLKPAGQNLFVIQFSNEATRDRVLEAGPWHIQNKPLIVRKWEPGLSTLEFNMAKLPLWIQLSNVPLDFFTQREISYIASAIGNPLYMDRITANQQKLSYAKVCVEIEVTKDIPRSIEVELRNGRTMSIMVEVPWMHAKCSQCRIFGHGEKFCPMKQGITKVWKPKSMEQKKIVVEARGSGSNKEVRKGQGDEYFVKARGVVSSAGAGSKGKEKEVEDTG